MGHLVTELIAPFQSALFARRRSFRSVRSPSWSAGEHCIPRRNSAAAAARPLSPKFHLYPLPRIFMCVWLHLSIVSKIVSYHKLCPSRIWVQQHDAHGKSAGYVPQRHNAFCHSRPCHSCLYYLFSFPFVLCSGDRLLFHINNPKKRKNEQSLRGI